MTVQQKRRSTAERLQSERAKLKKQEAALAELERKRADEIARIVLRSGLPDVTATDAQLAEAFKEVAARFHGGSTPPHEAKAPDHAAHREPAH